MAASLLALAVSASVALAIPLGTYTLQRAGHQFRHCNYQAYSTPPDAGNSDFIFDAVRDDDARAGVMRVLHVDKSRAAPRSGRRAGGTSELLACA